jgi:hypothetical protein
MTKLSIFTSNTNIAAVVVKKGTSKKPMYQLIKWDMSTNVFTEGQWLCSKHLAIHCCALSPNGKYFGWVYNRYLSGGAFKTYAGVSLLPNFTAIMYSESFCGTWDSVEFDIDSNPLNIHAGWEFKLSESESESETLILGDSTKKANSGLKSDYVRFRDIFGNLVAVQDYKILVNDCVVYDATHNGFRAREPLAY